MGERKEAVRAGQARKFLFDVAAKYEGDDCLIWPHARSVQGYGRLRNPDNRSQWLSAHRVVCELINGKPQADRNVVAHSCGNGHLGCVSPRHLRWATIAENNADKIIHGTENNGERNGRSKLSRNQVAEIRRLKGSVLQRELAKKYKVSEQLISAIHTRRRWPRLEAGK